MDTPVDEFTPEELRLAERLLDERLRSASRDEYRRMVEQNDPALNRGPVKVPREVVEQLREAVAAEVRARRTPPPPLQEEKRRWPWQRG
jgi:phosphoribosylaminoimidazole-succinocarboxamide synthase